MNDDLKNFWNDEKRLKKAEKEINQNKEVKHEITLNFDVYTNSIKFNKEEKNIQKNFNFTNKNSFEENKKYSPKFLIYFLAINTILIFINEELILLTLILWFITWVYSIISVISNEFKNGGTKTTWIIALIFIPLICLLYPDIKEIQIIKD